MFNLKKMVLIITVALATINVATISVEAAQKVYPATKNSKAYEVISEDCDKVKNGVVTITNNSKFYLYVLKSNYVMYYEKASGAKVSSVKTPTKSSKKVVRFNEKSFFITKDTTFKFKVVKKNATKTQIKNAKTYYVTVKVKKVSPFKKSSETLTMDYGDVFSFSVDRKDLYDDVKVYINGDLTRYTKASNGVYTYDAITKDTTIKVAAYKNNKKVGTKTYKITLKTYTKPTNYTFHTIESNWVLEGCQPIAYFTNGSTEWTKECYTAGTKVPDGFKLVEKYNGKSGYNYKLNTTNTYSYELYRARYYKVDGEYEFAKWEFVKKGTETYKVFKNNSSMGYYGFTGFKAPVNYCKGYEGVWVYCMKDGDNTVYRTFLKPGEALDTEYYWINAEIKINDERAYTVAQTSYQYAEFVGGFCTWDAYLAAYQGKHDFVNNYNPTVVTPDVPQ